LLCALWTSSNKDTGESNYKVYVCIIKHNYRLGGMLFTICKAQLHVLAANVVVLYI